MLSVYMNILSFYENSCPVFRFLLLVGVGVKIIFLVSALNLVIFFSYMYTKRHYLLPHICDLLLSVTFKLVYSLDWNEYMSRIPFMKFIFSKVRMQHFLFLWNKHISQLHNIIKKLLLSLIQTFHKIDFYCSYYLIFNWMSIVADSFFNHSRNPWKASSIYLLEIFAAWP